MTHTTNNSAATDHQIRDAVLRELALDPRVDAADVGVLVNCGTVTLTGFVCNLAEKLAAQEAAHRVRAVLDVANDIEVHNPSALARTDTEIAQALRMALEWDATVPQQKVKSTVSSGWVTLTGEVPTSQDRIRVERIVPKLLGVRGVVNNISVKSNASSAPTVKNFIDQFQQPHGESEADRIVVRVKDGTVSVTGRVNNLSEKQAVIGAACCATGLNKVEDHLRVDPNC